MTFWRKTLTISRCDPFQIIGDGEQTGIIIPDQGTYLLKSSYCSAVNISFPEPIMLETSGGQREYMQGHGYHDISLDIKAGEIEFLPGEVDLISKRIFEKLSILELFRIINQKLEKRG